MLQMLCEECSHFLEIAEAIRSLGLTILNGASEACGEKTCMCFVVEVGSEDRFISYSVKSVHFRNNNIEVMATCSLSKKKKCYKTIMHYGDSWLKTFDID